MRERTFETRQWSKRERLWLPAPVTVRGCDVDDCENWTGPYWGFPGGRQFCRDHRHLGEVGRQDE